MGPIPAHPTLPLKPSFATLTLEEVQGIGGTTRLGAADRPGNSDLEEEKLNSVTLNEVDRGWMVGPFSLDSVQHNAVVSRRRFGCATKC